MESETTLQSNIIANNQYDYEKKKRQETSQNNTAITISFAKSENTSYTTSPINNNNNSIFTGIQSSSEVNTINDIQANKVQRTKYKRPELFNYSKEDAEKVKPIIISQFKKVYGIDFTELSPSEQKLCIGLCIAARKRDIPFSELNEIMKAELNNEGESQLKELLQQHGANPKLYNRIDKLFEHLSAIRNTVTETAAKKAEETNPAEAMKIRENGIKDSENFAKGLGDMVINTVDKTDNLTDEKKDEIKQKAGKSLVNILKKHNLDYAKSTGSTHLINLAKSSNIALDKYYKTFLQIVEKQKGIRARIKKALKKLFVKTMKAKKENIKEKKEELHAKQIAAKEAMAKAALKKEEAQKLRKKALSYLENKGFKDVKAYKHKKLLKKENFALYQKLQEAEAVNKTAYWENYDAQSEVNLAQNSLAWAEFDIFNSCLDFSVRYGSLLG